MAAAMDHRMRQLEAQGLSGPECANRMAGHLPDLHRIWVSADDRQLAELCRDFPGFYRYASLMERASEIARTNPPARVNDLPELPDALKQPLLALLTNAATLERGYQTVIDAGQRAGYGTGLLTEMNTLRRQWLMDQKEFGETLHRNEAGLPEAALEFIDKALADFAGRINRLRARCLGV